MKHEYREGPESKVRFDKLGATLFRAPKLALKSTAKPVRTPKKTSKG